MTERRRTMRDRAIVVACALLVAACESRTAARAPASESNGWPVLDGMRAWCSSVTLASGGSEIHAAYFTADGPPAAWVDRYRTAAPTAAVEPMPEGGALFRSPNAEHPDRVLVVRAPDSRIPSGCENPPPSEGTVLELTRMSGAR